MTEIATRPASSLVVRSSSVVLPAPGEAHQVHRENPALSQPGPVQPGELVILGEYPFLQLNGPGRAGRGRHLDVNSLMAVTAARAEAEVVLVAVLTVVVVVVAGAVVVAGPGTEVIAGVVRDQPDNRVARAAACRAHVMPPGRR